MERLRTHAAARRTLIRRFSLLLLAGALAVAGLTFSSLGSAAPVTFTASADAYVVATSPSTNFGGQTDLRAGSSPDTRSYLTFNVK